MTNEELYQRCHEARTELATYPGVAGVGLGLKESGGKVTAGIALRVYVRDKQPLWRLSIQDRIPPVYRGVPTDVLPLGNGVGTTSSCEDHGTYSPLISGISVANGHRGPTGFAVGTLGFFATINGVEGPDNIVLVTNRHVLESGGGKKDDDVYQPNTAKSMPNNKIAEIHKLPEKQDFPFAYPGESQKQYFIDCASAQIKICISSCCSTNCGQLFANRVRLLSLNGSNKIIDVGRAQDGDIVYKVGFETGLTKGRVVNAAYSFGGAGLSSSNVIEIEPIEPNCDGLMRFSQEGDSGSAIIRSDGKLVGLLYSASPNASNKLACHIAPVLAALGVTAITQQNLPVNNKAFVTSGEIAATLDDEFSPIRQLRERFLRSPDGPRLAEVIDRHRLEVIRLVNHNRRVAVAWRRNQGPAFLNHAINNSRDPARRIPREIEGITRETLLARMGDALAGHGSVELRDAVARYRDEVLAGAEVADNLHDLVEQLAERRAP